MAPFLLFIVIIYEIYEVDSLICLYLWAGGVCLQLVPKICSYVLNVVNNVLSIDIGYLISARYDPKDKCQNSLLCNCCVLSCVVAMHHAKATRC